MFGTFDIGVAIAFFVLAFLLWVGHIGYALGVKHTEERWSDAVGRTQRDLGPHGSRH